MVFVRTTELLYAVCQCVMCVKKKVCGQHDRNYLNLIQPSIITENRREIFICTSHELACQMGGQWWWSL